jgi:perosamine synthetase
VSDTVARFESEFSARIGSRYAIAVNSGTSALHAALVACNVKKQEVIMPALCPAMDAFAIIHAGGIPVFADVDPFTGLMTAQTIEPCITEHTKAIIAVHLHGLPCDMDPIMELGNTYALWIIEDCAQALLARYKSKTAGTIGHMGCFSFEKKKHMTTGSEGGMIVTDDKVLAVVARKFAGIGYKHMTAEAGRTSLSAATFQRPDYERFDTIGLNYRMSEAQAGIGLMKMGLLEQEVARRQRIGFMWQHALVQQCQPHTYDADNAFYSAAYDYRGDWIGFYERFVAAGGDGFYAMPKCPYQEPALAKVSIPWTNCPVAEGLQKRLCLLKTHYSLLEATRQVEILHDLLRP